MSHNPTSNWPSSTSWFIVFTNRIVVVPWRANIRYSWSKEVRIIQQRQNAKHHMKASGQKQNKFLLRNEIRRNSRANGQWRLFLNSLSDTLDWSPSRATSKKICPAGQIMLLPRWVHITMSNIKDPQSYPLVWVARTIQRYDTFEVNGSPSYQQHRHQMPL